MFKKIYVFIACILFVFVVSGCFFEQEDTQEETEEQYNDAAMHLPMPFWAYPGSVIILDLLEAEIYDIPSWALRTPVNTSRDEVIDYYMDVADEYDNIEFHDDTVTYFTWELEDIIYSGSLMVNDDPNHPGHLQIIISFEEETD